MVKQKYYVVWKGRQTGIFNTWDECSAQVKGFINAEFKAFDSQPAAEAALRAPYADQIMTRPIKTSQGKLAGAAGHPIPESYCVDAACSGNPGRMEYRCVETATGREIFHAGPFDVGTNNIGEFLGVVEALMLCHFRNLTLPIYTDSKIALSWLKIKKCKTNLPVKIISPKLYERIQTAESWLHNNNYPNKVLKWETEAWGEIPADYGRK